jgi:hypothetical protein
MLSHASVEIVCVSGVIPVKGFTVQNINSNHMHELKEAAPEMKRPRELVTQLGFEPSLYPSENQYLFKHLNQQVPI